MENMMDRVILLKIMNCVDARTFLSMRTCNKRFHETAKLANRQWMGLLGRWGRRKIGKNSVHYFTHQYCIEPCKQANHYYDLELVVLKTIPLWQQVFRRIVAVKITSEKASKERYASLYTNHARRLTRNRRRLSKWDLQTLSCWQNEVSNADDSIAELTAIGASYGYGRRKRIKLDHSVNT